MSQITSNIMMIRPANFGFNTQTAANNSFQTDDSGGDANETAKKAQHEFDNMVELLRSKNINVEVINDTTEPTKPDAIFPNNWISLHKNGSAVTYPMFAPNRRIERREDIITTLEKKYKVNRRYSFEHYEEDNLFLEGTGSMIFDRENKIVYACISERTDPTLIDKFCVLMGTERAVFHSVDKQGDLIYHTNVMMALGQKFVVICMDSINDEEERKMLRSNFERTNKVLIEISQDQVEQFAGNMLEVRSSGGKPYLVMSQTAFESLNDDQIQQIKKYTEILAVQIPTIEHYGGGSVRCMMAEIFLPTL